MKKIILMFFLVGCSLCGLAQQLPDTARVISIINRVNRYWQDNHTAERRAFWDHAAYHTGNMEAYKITGDTAFLRYSERWATYNNWMGAKSTDPESWKYSYGETDDYVLFGDWQICFQTYIDLYQLDPQAYKIARASAVMEYQMSTPQNDYLWWVDGLYMVMPVMSKLYKISGNPRYSEKLYAYFNYANQLLYDAKKKLYYRDAKYIYAKHKTLNGQKDFWARGNGWVFAGLAKVLADLPKDDVHFQDYKNNFQALAKSIVSSQHKGGYWTRSLLDGAQAPGPETSGTAFFCYGLLWGINNGLLDDQAAKTAAIGAFDYLSKTALQENGQVGYVQPIGEKAIPGQIVDRNSTADFGVGAFLLASSEMYRFLKHNSSNHP